jgi:hypothetical protein
MKSGERKGKIYGEIAGASLRTKILEYEREQLEKLHKRKLEIYDQTTAKEKFYLENFTSINKELEVMKLRDLNVSKEKTELEIKQQKALIGNIRQQISANDALGKSWKVPAEESKAAREKAVALRLELVDQQNTLKNLTYSYKQLGEEIKLVEEEQRRYTGVEIKEKWGIKGITERRQQGIFPSTEEWEKLYRPYDLQEEEKRIETMQSFEQNALKERLQAQEKYSVKFSWFKSKERVEEEDRLARTR